MDNVVVRFNSNGEKISDFPQRCRVDASLVDVVIQTEMVSCDTNGRKTLKVARNWTRFVWNTRVWIGPPKCLLLCSEHFTQHCYETTEMARCRGYLPRLREDAIPTIKWKKRPSLETVTLSLPSYQHMYTGDFSGESITYLVVCACPTILISILTSLPHPTVNLNL